MLNKSNTCKFYRLILPVVIKYYSRISLQMNALKFKKSMLRERTKKTWFKNFLIQNVQMQST